MKKWIAIALLAGLIYFFPLVKNTPSPIITKNSPSPRIRKSPSNSNAKQLQPKSMKSVNALLSSTNPKIVSFEVKEGFAVAHGDVILGIPEDSSIREGYYQMPEPLYWDTTEIPYAIDADVVSPERIEIALKHIEQKTGIRFVPFEDQPDAILFQTGKEHCLSNLGRQGGVQPIKLSPQCGWNEIIHEILHAFGLIHEQSRSDRDAAIQIFWDHIEEKYRPQFAILPESFLGPSKNLPFDYQSIMLYSVQAFAKSKDLMTMKSLSTAQIQPSTQGLSQQDIAKIKMLFGIN